MGQGYFFVNENEQILRQLTESTTSFI